jgi:hypothetical protein
MNTLYTLMGVGMTIGVMATLVFVVYKGLTVVEHVLFK